MDSTIYVILAIMAMTITTLIIIIYYLRSKKKEDLSLNITGNSKFNSDEAELASKMNQKELVIQMEMLPEEKVNESKLIEITDSNVLTRINHLVPGLAQSSNAVRNASQVAKQSGTLYKAVIPSGATLTKSATNSNAFRGIYHGAKGVKGHANLVPVDVGQGATVAANTAAAAMNVGSLVVGQYYMTKINDELEEINKNISMISDFQDNEFRSKVFSLLAHIEKLANFQVEILDNDELRLSKISQLDNLEVQSTELLGQVNLTLIGSIKENKLKYSVYEKDLENMEKWHMYQQSLMKILSKISELKYTLHFGEVSREQCSAILSTYTKQVIDTKDRLNDWHKDITDHLKIDTAEGKRKRKGLDGALYFVPSLFKEEFKYKNIADNTVNMIESQSTTYEELYNYDNSDLYSEDVQLVAKDNKVYYLPEDIETVIK